MRCHSSRHVPLLIFTSSLISETRFLIAVWLSLHCKHAYKSTGLILTTLGAWTVRTAVFYMATIQSSQRLHCLMDRETSNTCDLIELHLIIMLFRCRPYSVPHLKWLSTREIIMRTFYAWIMHFEIFYIELLQCAFKTNVIAKWSHTQKCAFCIAWNSLKPKW